LAASVFSAVGLRQYSRGIFLIGLETELGLSQPRIIISCTYGFRESGTLKSHLITGQVIIRPVEKKILKEHPLEKRRHVSRPEFIV
jgi:hypothetical protein